MPKDFYGQAYSLPLVIIIVPTYNRLHFLKQAVASIRDQTYSNWKLVIVDDGSTDGTKEWLLALNDKKISALFLPHCGNIAALRNTGVAATHDGDWIAFLDSDDLWSPEKLDLQIQGVLAEGKMWAYCGAALINDFDERVAYKTRPYLPISGWILKQLLNNEATVSIGSLLLHRKLFEKLHGFDPDPGLILREDIELAFRLSALAEGLALPQILVFIREHAGRSTNLIADAHERTAFLYAYFEKKCADKKLKNLANQREAFHLTELAKKYMQQKKYRRAIALLKNAFYKGDKIRHVLSAFWQGLNKKRDTSTC